MNRLEERIVESPTKLLDEAGERDAAMFARATRLPLPELTVDASGGPVVPRLAKGVPVLGRSSWAWDLRRAPVLGGPYDGHHALRRNR